MKSMHLNPVLAAFLLQCAKNVVGLTTELNIANSPIAPDGFSRSSVLANGTFPGPLLKIQSPNENVEVNVVDSLTDPTMNRATSIHWHGLFQAHTPEMDGPAFVTQCPIVPDNSFLYNFNVANQTGTYWYHSHLALQYCDGLRGPLVIYDPNDPLKHLYDVDNDDTVITLADWYHSPTPELWNPVTKNAVAPVSTLVNGLGRWNASQPDQPLAVVNVQPNLSYRFRVVSLSCFPSFNLSIDSHRLIIIETDGVETQPLTVDSLNIFAAQRYSLVLQANQQVGNYWIRALPSTPATASFTGGMNSAILRYAGAPIQDPTTTQTPGVPLNESLIQPLNNPGAPGKPVVGGVDHAYNLVINKSAASDNNFTINNFSFVPPNVPVLLQILSGASDPLTLLPQGSIYPIPSNSVIEVSIPGGGQHPFHLHGHSFDVIRVAGQPGYNFNNPVRRDTVSIGNAGDNVTFRFVTDNPGPWFLHCHIDWHLEAGLAIVFAEDTGAIPTVDPPNSAWEALCPEYNLNDPDRNLTTPV